jgi:hypothetical protein
MDVGFFWFFFLMACTLGFAGFLAYLRIVSPPDQH